MELEVFTYCGAGEALGCEITVVAETKVIAVDLINEWLKQAGLACDNTATVNNVDNEGPLEPNSVVHSWNGDY